jgi:hypothetical protein
MEKKTLGWILLAAAIIALVLIVIYNGPQKGLPDMDEPALSDTLSPIQKTDKKITREEDRVSIDITYPEFVGVPAVINSDIKSFADNEVTELDSLKLEEIPTMSDAQYFLKINYEAEQANTDFISLVFTISTYTGGAHPNQFFRTFNYNVDTGTVVTLADLYPNEKDALESLKPKIKTAVHDSLKATFEANGDMGSDPDEALFKDITDIDDKDTFANFTFGTSYIKFFFSPYDIAPYSVGPVIARIDR